jgi:hypothetical protein
MKITHDQVWNLKTIQPIKFVGLTNLVFVLIVSMKNVDGSKKFLTVFDEKISS